MATVSLDLDAQAQARFASTVSIDAQAQAQFTGTTDIDAQAQARFTGTLSADAVTQKVYTRTVSLDAVKVKGYTKTLSLDALIQTSGAVVKNVTPVYGVAGQFNHGSSDSDISYIVLTNAGGTPCFVYPNATADGITVSSTRP